MGRWWGHVYKFRIRVVAGYPRRWGRAAGTGQCRAAIPKRALEQQQLSSYHPQPPLGYGVIRGVGAIRSILRTPRSSSRTDPKPGTYLNCALRPCRRTTSRRLRAVKPDPTPRCEDAVGRRPEAGRVDRSGRRCQHWWLAEWGPQKLGIGPARAGSLAAK